MSFADGFATHSVRYFETSQKSFSSEASLKRAPWTSEGKSRCTTPGTPLLSSRKAVCAYSWIRFAMVMRLPYFRMPSVTGC
jgi:hypothetical protein